MTGGNQRRAFLDDACTDVLHISGHAKRLTQQRGSYTTWAKRRAEQQATWARKSKDRADQRAKMYERANCGFRFGGSDMNKQQQLLKQIEEILITNTVGSHFKLITPTQAN